MNRSTTLSRTRPTVAMIVAFLALFVALGSGSYAAGILTGKDVKNSSLTGQDLRNESVTGKDVKNLTGNDLDESTLDTVPNAEKAATATSATTADTASDAEEVGGVPAAQLLKVPGCQTGKVLGFARIKANGGTIPSTYTTSSSYVDSQNNCSGSSVVVRRDAVGQYLVKFTGNPAFLAFAQVRFESDISDTDVCASLRKVTTDGPDHGAFEVSLMECDGSSFQDADFTLLLP